MQDPPSGSRGRFSAGAALSFGGQYVAPVLLPVLDRLEQSFRLALSDAAFQSDFARLLADHVARPTPLMMLGENGEEGAALLLKREDLTNAGGCFGTGVLGQCLLARKMGMKSVVADTGSGDHGVAVAATASKLGLDATIFIADTASRSQLSMVARMEAFGATVERVPGEASMLHHAMSGAIQYWMANGDTCLYVAGGPIGPYPYPDIVRHFQAVIGRETRAQVLDRFGRLPSDAVVTMDGGSAAIGLFSAFLDDPVRLIIAESAGSDSVASPAVLSHGRPGVLHGAFTLLLQDGDGQILDVRSLAPGASYPAAGPELAAWAQKGRVKIDLVEELEAIATMRWAAEHHGVLVSVEAAFGLASARKRAARLQPGDCVVCAISADGAKDLALMERILL